MIVLLVFVLGLILGSFANVVIARLPHDASVITPRSRCPHCEKPIAAWDNIPIVSYLWLGGKCRNCRAAIDIRYPIVELLMGLVFMTVWMKHWEWGLATVVRDAFFAFCLVVVTFIDLDHRIIPNEVSLGGLVVGLATAALDPRLNWGDWEWRVMQSALGAGLGYGIFSGFSWIYRKLTGRVGLGGGDVKLLAMIGAFLGPAGVVATLLVSSVSGSVVGLAWGLLEKKKNLRQLAIPYGPFLALGALFYDFLGEHLEWLQILIPT